MSYKSDENGDGTVDWKDGLKGDLFRMGIVLAAIVVLNVIDLVLPAGVFAYLTAVLSSTSVVLFIAAASHLMRKVFFPQISLTDLYTEAKAHPLGAGIVFLGITLVLSSLIFVNVMLLN